MTLTWGDIKRWDETAIADAASGLRSRATSLEEVKAGLKTLPIIGRWEGQGATAANQSLDKIAKNIMVQTTAQQEAAAAMDQAAMSVTVIKKVQQAAESEASQGHFLINDQTGEVTKDPRYDDQNPEVKQDIEAKVRQVLEAANTADGDLRHAVNLASGAEAASATIYDGKPVYTAKRDSDIEAFREMFGRAPTTPADFATAAALNPNSYDPKNNAPPEIRAAKIEPHPGWGTVRTNFFIPQREVAYPSPSKGQGHNLGDNRGFDPYADPEHSRVSVLVDYENGVVVTRQNPSVDSVTLESRAGVPWVSAAQNKDGAVMISYNTADPFSPGGETVAKASSYSVHGGLAIQGGANGPTVGGSITQFPAVEIYHDNPMGQTNTVFTNMPANTTSYGPMVGLVGVQDIGDQNLYNSFDTAKLVPLGGVSAPPVITPQTPPPSLGGGLPPIPAGTK